MKRKTIIAVLTACMMLLTLSPATVSAVTVNDYVRVHHSDTMGIMDEYEEEIRQQLLEWLDMAYKESIKAKSSYCTEVWQDIQAVYKEGRAAINTLSLEDFWLEEIRDYESILEELGMLTWVKSKKDLPAVKSKYRKEIDSEYRNYKRADYNDYYWDQIQDCMYVGKKQMENANSFSDAVEGYLYALLGMEVACDKEEIKERRDEIITELNQYVNLGLDQSKYTSNEWTRILEIRDQAIGDLKATDLESVMDEIYETVSKEFFAITGVKFPLEGETIIDELCYKLDEFYYSLDESLYSDEMLDLLDEICYEAEDALYEAQTREEAQKIYDAAMAKMKAVPTKKEEIAVMQTLIPKITSVHSKNSSTVKITWKKVKNASGYAVYRASSVKGTYKKIKKVKGISFAETTCKLGKDYYYKIRAYKTIDKKDYYSKYSSAVKGTAMLAKTSLTLAKSGTNAVEIKWKKVKAAKGYQIYRAASYNGQYTKVKTVKGEASVSWKDTHVKKGQKYYYKVRSYCKINGKTQYSPYSSVKSIKR